MSYAATIETANPIARAHQLGVELRLLRTRTDLLSTGATIHSLRNTIATAQGALSLAGKYQDHGRESDADALLELAEKRLMDARRLLSTQRGTMSGRRRLAAVAG